MTALSLISHASEGLPLPASAARVLPSADQGPGPFPAILEALEQSPSKGEASSARTSVRAAGQWPERTRPARPPASDPALGSSEPVPATPENTPPAPEIAALAAPVAAAQPGPPPQAANLPATPGVDGQAGTSEEPRSLPPLALRGNDAPAPVASAADGAVPEMRVLPPEHTGLWGSLSAGAACQSNPEPRGQAVSAAPPAISGRAYGGCSLTAQPPAGSQTCGSTPAGNGPRHSLSQTNNETPDPAGIPLFRARWASPSPDRSAPLPVTPTQMQTAPSPPQDGVNPQTHGLVNRSGPLDRTSLIAEVTRGPAWSNFGSQARASSHRSEAAGSPSAASLTRAGIDPTSQPPIPAERYEPTDSSQPADLETRGVASGRLTDLSHSSSGSLASARFLHERQLIPLQTGESSQPEPQVSAWSNPSASMPIEGALPSADRREAHPPGDTPALNLASMSPSRAPAVPSAFTGATSAPADTPLSSAAADRAIAASSPCTSPFLGTPASAGAAGPQSTSNAHSTASQHSQPAATSSEPLSWILRDAGGGLADASKEARPAASSRAAHSVAAPAGSSAAPSSDGYENAASPSAARPPAADAGNYQTGAVESSDPATPPPPLAFRAILTALEQAAVPGIPDSPLHSATLPIGSFTADPPDNPAGPPAGNAPLPAAPAPDAIDAASQDDPTSELRSRKTSASALPAEPDSGAAGWSFTAPPATVANARSDGRTAASTPSTPAAPELPEPVKQAVQPVRDLKLDLGAGESRVEVRVADRGGELRVAVHTPDERLAGDLREHLPSLASRLEQSGLRAETWHAASGAGQSPRAAETAFSGGAESHQGQGHAQSRDRRQDAPPRRPGEPAGTSGSAEKGDNFRWLLDALR